MPNRKKRTRSIKKPRWGLPGSEPPNGNLAPLNFDEELLSFAIQQFGPLSEIDKEWVRQEIELTATLCRALATLENDAPRRGDVHLTLRELCESAEILRDRISELDLRSLALLRDFNGVYQNENWSHDREFSALCNGEGSEIVAMLDQLILATRQASGSLKGTNSPESFYWGSNSQDEAVFGSWRIFCHLCPEDISTTQGGKFREFVGTLWELVSGERDKDLERSVKKLLKAKAKTV